MIIARAPLRVSFGGGGTDLPAYYEQFGGLVVSVAIDRFIYVVMRQSRSGVLVTSPDEGIQAAQSVPSESPGNRLPLLVADRCAPGRGLRMFIAGEVPSGTGLGSSSALTVALIAGIGTLVGSARSAVEIAELACEIEIVQLGSPIGKQDQYASALGGMNAITFNQDGSVVVEPLRMESGAMDTLERRLMLLFLGTRRAAGSVLASQQRRSAEGDRRTIAALNAIKSLAGNMQSALRQGDLDGFGTLLHDSWMQKMQVANGISTGYIDHCYETARRAGASGGKVTGAGGGGFLLLYCREEMQPAVTRALEPLGITRMPFDFTSHGAEVVLNNPDLDGMLWAR
jgi:D-glycero-alpha-D-manno-heptose-7-phosphate kinase